jgi:aspartate 1-decarboxylase
MLRFIAKSKIQRPRVTDKNLRYEGSITVDRKLLRLADIVPGEMVQVVNVTTGARFETYTMAGKPGEICLNGGTARLGEVGDELIIISYGVVSSTEARRHRMRKVLVSPDNRLLADASRVTRQR